MGEVQGHALSHHLEPNFRERQCSFYQDASDFDPALNNRYYLPQSSGNSQHPPSWPMPLSGYARPSFPYPQATHGQP